MESYCSFMIIIKGLELLFSIHNIAVNDFKMFTVSCTTTWPNCILILSRILKKQSKIELLLCHNVYDDVTDFEVCWFNKKHKKYIYIWRTKHYICLHWKNSYCVRCPYAVPFLKNEMPFSQLKTPKTHAV